MSRNVMETENKTEVTEIVLLRLSQTHEVQLFLFFLFLLFYVIVLPVNILIILIVRGDPQLDSPMYFFLAILAFLDICYCSITPPKMLADFFWQQKTISTRSCIAQLFFLHFLGGTEIFLLIAMAFDSSLCNLNEENALLGLAWAGGFIHSIIQVAFVVHLPFCGPNKLDSFFCDVTQVINLARTNTYILEFTIFVNSGLVIFICFILLLISYGVLLIHLKTGISRGKSKAVSTCTTHIIVVWTAQGPLSSPARQRAARQDLLFSRDASQGYSSRLRDSLPQQILMKCTLTPSATIIIAFVMFGPAIYIYCRPFCSLPLDKMVAVFHTMVFPLRNPMIYTLRNREILSAMKRLLSTDGESNTTVNKFLLLGLTRSAALQSFHFITFIVIYGARVVGNLLIIVLLICEPRLHKPMYILLQNLSFLGCCYSSITAPKVLTGFLLPPPQAISFVGCIVQIFFFHFTGGIKIFFLTVIAYDHYVAIFHTFCYMILRNQMACVGLLVTCCVGGFLHSVVQVAVIVHLPFCGPKELDNFYCDVK
ncbi:hypothetical protein QYF61_005802 [Mycteria americana]|uniref:G-protein coupled receptors family 1 profile domain-containing protein n=1 Tax=Mycteria americana TaxID=33587 RepID=A0AAN7MKI1_MYCAM|nr:hypothetical protein QYF61_005802 [Mycteria americana]